MGRTVPTFRNAVEDEIKRWKEFRKSLRKKDREAFDELLEDCKRHLSACSQANDPEPFRAMAISMILEQQKKLDSLKETISQIRDRIEGE